MATMYLSTDQFKLSSAWRVEWDDTYHRIITVPPSTASTFRTFQASALPAGSVVQQAIMRVQHTSAWTGGTVWAAGVQHTEVDRQIEVTNLFQHDQQGVFADFAVEFKWKANGTAGVTTNGIKYSGTTINAQIEVTYTAGEGREFDPEAYHEAAIADDRQIKTRMMIYYPDGSSQPVGDDMIIGWEINEGNDSGVLLGTCSSARLDLTLANPEGEWFLGGSMRKYRELYGAKITMEIGLLVDGEWIYNPAGTYVNEEFSGAENEPAMQMSGYDEMGNALESEFHDALTYPATLSDVLAEVVRNAGIGVEGVLATNRTAVIPKKPDWGDKCTIRKALSFVCAAGGSYARVTRQGSIGISNAWKETPLLELGPENYMGNDYDERIFTFNRIVITPRGAQNSDTTIQAAVSAAVEELPSNTLYIDDNPLFVQGQQIAQTMANNLRDTLNGAVWANMRLRWRGNPSIEIGTRIQYTDTGNRIKTATIMAQKMAWDEGFDSTAICLIDTHEITKTGAVTGGGMIDTKKIALEGIGGQAIASQAITTRHLTANAVTADNIQAGAITAEKIDAGAITTEKLDAEAVTAEKIDAGAITTDKLDAQAVTAGKIASNAVTTGKLAADAVTAAKIAAGAIEAQHFSADALTAINAEIQNADISYAKIKDANVENLITKDAIADRYYIDKLQVRNLQVIEQTVGNLVVKASNGNYYRLDVGNNGAVTSTQVTVTSGEIAAGVTNTGRSIIETDLTVSDLAASNIKGANALIDKLTAARISVDELFARDATIGKLQTTDISSNTSLQTYVADRLDFTVGKLPFVNPNILLAADTDVATTGYPTIRYDPYVDAVTGQEATLVVGEQYTFTVRLQTQSAAAGNVMLYTSGGYVQLVSIPLYSEGTAWATYRGTFTFNGYGTQRPDDHQLRVYCTPQGRPVRIQWAKLEKGDHATDFCLSPAEMKNSGISIKPDSLNIYSSGTMNIASDGKMVIESGAEGRINLNDGSISTKNLNAQELTVGGKQVGVNAFMLSLPAVFTQGASSAPAGHGFLWLNASGSSYSSAQTRGATSDGYLPRTFTLDAPENTLSAGTFTYTCTCAITNRQGSNPATITPNITVKITNKSSGANVSFAFDQVTVRKWESKNLTKTVTTTVNLFGANAQFDAECTFTRSGGTTGTPDMDSGVDIVLTATKQNAGGAQSVTVQYVP